MDGEVLKIKISGTVQGVFFRHSAGIRARELRLKGFIRNEKDGSVYAEAEGSRENLEKFLEWCRKGPPLASVDKVEFSYEKASGALMEFEIE